MPLTLMGAAMTVPELGKRVLNGNAPEGTATPAGIYAVVSVTPGGPVLELFNAEDPDVPTTVMQDYVNVALFDAMRTGDRTPGDVTQRLYAVMQKVLKAAKAVDTDHDGVTPLCDPLRLRWTPRPLPDSTVAHGQYMTASFICRTVR